MTVLSGAEVTAAKRAVERLAIDYAAYVDGKDYGGVTGLFSESGILRGRRSRGSDGLLVYDLHGRDQIHAQLVSLDRYTRTFHQLGQHAVNYHDGSLTGECYCTAGHLYESDRGASLYVMYIRYHDQYVVENGEWRFAERLLWIDFDETRHL
jgi:hypothetical protein